MLKMVKSCLSFSILERRVLVAEHSYSFVVKKAISSQNLVKSSLIENPFCFDKSWFWRWKLSSRRLIKAVKLINAELRIDQLSDLKFSIETIIARVMNELTSQRKNASQKITLMMLKAWILLSSFFSVSDSSNYDNKKSRVLFKRSVSSDFFSVMPLILLYDFAAFTRAGSDLKIANMVGGIPADRLRMELWDSLVILWSALSSIYIGSAVYPSDDSSCLTKFSNVSAVIAIAPLCLA